MLFLSKTPQTGHDQFKMNQSEMTEYVGLFCLGTVCAESWFVCL